MFQTFKLWKLAAALKRPGNSPETYSAVIELGRVGQGKAVDLLIKALARRDGVSRSAARELGRLRDPRAITPLASLLEDREVSQSAAEALVQLGPPALDGLVPILKTGSPAARHLAATALGDIGERHAVEPLIETLAHDDDYTVRTAAAVALGQVKDQRAVWVLVATLKLRDEVSPDRQKALKDLQTAAQVALHKIGDPLATRASSNVLTTAAQAVERLEQAAKDAELHPRLIGDLALLSEPDLVGVLKELIAASEEISWAKLEEREPLLPACFKNYEQRRQTAETVGTELYRRGGTALMEKVFKRELQSYATISNWWVGIGNWQSQAGT
jgi:HEAT repeat protein